MDDSHQSEKRRLDKRDYLDAILVTLCLLVLLWWQGWFPFNGFLDSLTGKGEPAQPALSPAQPEEIAPAPRRVAPPAPFEEIAKACVVVCSVRDKKSPCGSGVFVGVGQEGEKPRIFLLTAAHVAELVAPGITTNVVAFIVHRPNKDTDLRKVVYIDGTGWLTPGGVEDIAMVDVTSAFDRMVDEGLDVKYIYATILPVEDVPPNAVKGALAVRRELFGQYNIGLGTEIRALGMATELWRSNVPKERVRQPLALRAGVIATRHDTPMLPGTSEGSFIVDARLAPGFSGGPVFAMVRNGYLEYPALAGVCLGVVKGLDFDDAEKARTVTESVQSAYGIVTPLDKMFMYKAAK